MLVKDESTMVKFGSMVRMSVKKLIRVRLKNTEKRCNRNLDCKERCLDGCKMAQGKLLAVGILRIIYRHKHKGHGMT